MSDIWGRGRGSVDRAAERIRRIFGSEADRQRLEQEEVERLRASGWLPTRPVPLSAPEGGYGVADAGEAIQRQMDHENAYLDEARRRLAGRQQLAQAPAADLPPIPPRKPNYVPGQPSDLPVEDWELHRPLAIMNFRGADVRGGGWWGAPRDDGSRPHRGVDLAAPPGTQVFAPASGRVVKFDPYENDPKKAGNVTAIQIVTDDQRKIDVLYIKPHSGLKTGDTITIGAPLGISQSLQGLYPQITDHVHMATRDHHGRPVDPTKWLKQHRNKKTHYDR